MSEHEYSLADLLSRREPPDLDAVTKKFCAHLVHGQSILAREFYANYTKDYLAEHPIFANSNLYFIVQRPKLHFVPEESYLDNDGNLHIRVIAGGSNQFTLEVETWSIVAKWLESSTTSQFDINNLHVGVFANRTDYLEALEIFRQDDSSAVAFGGSFNDGWITKETVTIEIHTPDKRILVLIHPYALCDDLSAPSAEYVNIVYIGQTQSLEGLAGRLSKHEQLQKAALLCPDDKEIYLYFFLFQTRTQCLNMMPPLTAELSQSKCINILEMVLINYFKPEYNTDFINANLVKNSQIQKHLQKNGYTHIVVEVNFEAGILGVQWRFGSMKAKPHNYHFIELQLQP